MTLSVWLCTKWIYLIPEDAYLAERSRQCDNPIIVVIWVHLLSKAVSKFTRESYWSSELSLYLPYKGDSFVWEQSLKIVLDVGEYKPICFDQLDNHFRLADLPCKVHTGEGLVSTRNKFSLHSSSSMPSPECPREA